MPVKSAASLRRRRRARHYRDGAIGIRRVEMTASRSFVRREEADEVLMPAARCRDISSPFMVRSYEESFTDRIFSRACTCVSCHR